MTETSFALFVHDDRYDLPAIVQIEPKPFGHPSLDWRDVSGHPGIQVGWVAYPDGHIGPYVPPLEVALAHQKMVIRADCRVAIEGGFSSDALGAPHRYGSSDSDQTNLSHDAAAALVSSDGWTASIACSDQAGVKVARPHDAKQVAKLLLDFQKFRSDAQAKLRQLNEKISKAPSVDIVRSVRF